MNEDVKGRCTELLDELHDDMKRMDENLSTEIALTEADDGPYFALRSALQTMRGRVEELGALLAQAESP